MPRERNGRISRRLIDRSRAREMSPDEAKSVAIAARARHSGLPEHYLDLTDAGRPNAGTVHGLLHLRSRLDYDQWRAAEWYCGTRLAWLRSIHAKDVPTGPPPRDGSDDDGYAEWCVSIRATWDKLQGTISRASVATRQPLRQALASLQASEPIAHLVPALRLALDVIHAEFLSRE